MVVPVNMNVMQGHLVKLMPEDISQNIVLGTNCDITVTVDWPDGEKKAEEICDEVYNNSGEMSCTCEKVN